MWALLICIEQKHLLTLVIKHLRQSTFYGKVAALKPLVFFKKECFTLVFFIKFLRTLFLKNTFGWLFLNNNRDFKGRGHFSRFSRICSLSCAKSIWIMVLREICSFFHLLVQILHVTHMQSEHAHLVLSDNLLTGNILLWNISGSST